MRRAGYERHGMSLTPEYRAWADMIQRCVNPNTGNYRHYGARGISVHPEWVVSFSAFIADVGFRPGARMTIERVDNSAGYVPGNVVWASRSDQNRNRRIIGKSPYKGVSFKIVGGWRAYICLGGKKMKHIGYFKSEVDAMLAYNREAFVHGMAINPIPTLVDVR